MSTTPDKRETLPVLSKCERAAVLGMRGNQLSAGDNPRVPLKQVRDGHVTWLTDPLEIAEKELVSGVILLDIDRRLHRGAPPEQWHVSELALSATASSVQPKK